MKSWNKNIIGPLVVDFKGLGCGIWGKIIHGQSIKTPGISLERRRKTVYTLYACQMRLLKMNRRKIIWLMRVTQFEQQCGMRSVKSIDSSTDFQSFEEKIHIFEKKNVVIILFDIYKSAHGKVAVILKINLKWKVSYFFRQIISFIIFYWNKKIKKGFEAIFKHGHFWRCWYASMLYIIFPSYLRHHFFSAAASNQERQSIFICDIFHVFMWYTHIILVL